MIKFFPIVFLFIISLSAADKPNIILIMADDMGYGELGCTGHPTFKTPVLDKLAKEGLRLTDFHSNGAVCSPTRAALMTGRYQSRSGIEGVVTAAKHRHTGLPLKETTMAEALKGAGYKTAMFGKWHLGYESKFNPVHQGFDKFHGFVSGNIDLFSHIDQEGHKDWWVQDELVDEPGYMTKTVTDLSIKFINENKEKPFFLYIPHAAPHYPYQGPNDKAYRKPGVPQPIQGAVEDKDRAYKEMVEYMDTEIGRIIEELENLNIRQNTLIIFTSDNGGTGKYGSSNAPFSGKKGQFLEGGHRVPCILNWPGKISEGKTSDAPVMCMDFMPTFLNLAGAYSDTFKFDGVDLSSFLMEGKKLKDRPLFWKKGDQFAMREGEWKILKNGKQIALFNLKNDPQEKIDLASQNPKVLKAMLSSYNLWKAEVTSGVEIRSK